MFPGAPLGILSRTIQFVFPAHNNRRGKQGPQAREDFFRRVQDQTQFGYPTANLSCAIDSFDLVHQEIAEGCSMKDRRRLIRKRLESGKQ